MSTFDFTESSHWKDSELAHEIASAVPQKPLIARGAIRSTKSIDMGESWCFSCVLADGTGEVQLLFMGRRNIAGLQPGTICTVQGTVGKDGNTLQVWNPLYRIEPAQ